MCGASWDVAVIFQEESSGINTLTQIRSRKRLIGQYCDTNSQEEKMPGTIPDTDTQQENVSPNTPATDDTSSRPLPLFSWKPPRHRNLRKDPDTCCELLALQKNYERSWDF